MAEGEKVGDTELNVEGDVKVRGEEVEGEKVGEVEGDVEGDAYNDELDVFNSYA